MKIKLKRVKKGVNKISMNAPDYEGFFTNNKNKNFYVVGWIDLMSNLTLDIKSIDNKMLENKFFMNKYTEFLKKKISK